MPRYIVLQPISPEQGPLIMPAQVDPRNPDVIPEPVVVDETVISAESAPILIERGVIALLPKTKTKAAPAEVDDLKF